MPSARGLLAVVVAAAVAVAVATSENQILSASYPEGAPLAAAAEEEEVVVVSADSDPPAAKSELRCRPKRMTPPSV